MAYFFCFIFFFPLKIIVSVQLRRRRGSPGDENSREPPSQPAVGSRNPRSGAREAVAGAVRGRDGRPPGGEAASGRRGPRGARPLPLRQCWPYRGAGTAAPRRSQASGPGSAGGRRGLRF